MFIDSSTIEAKGPTLKTTVSSIDMVEPARDSLATPPTSIAAKKRQSTSLREHRGLAEFSACPRMKKRLCSPELPCGNSWEDEAPRRMYQGAVEEVATPSPYFWGKQHEASSFLTIPTSCNNEAHSLPARSDDCPSTRPRPQRFCQTQEECYPAFVPVVSPIAVAPPRRRVITSNSLEGGMLQLRMKPLLAGTNILEDHGRVVSAPRDSVFGSRVSYEPLKSCLFNAFFEKDSEVPSTPAQARLAAPAATPEMIIKNRASIEYVSPSSSPTDSARLPYMGF